MEEDTLGKLFRILTPVSILVGIVFITMGTPIVTGVGVLLTIFGLMSILPTMRFNWMTEG